MLLRAIPSFQHRYPEVRLILLSINETAVIGDEGIDVGYNGYGVIDFEGRELRAEYHDLTGEVVYHETIEVDRAGALRVRSTART